MKVVLAKKAGFCMGVRRAVESTLETVRSEEKSIATFGPLIHNPQVLGILKEQGVETLREIPDQREGTIIIRAHGVPPQTKERLMATGATIKDATCPRVVKVQVIIKKYRDQGYTTVIIGDRNHAEVDGLVGYAGAMVHVVSNEQEARELFLAGPYIIVSQTTQDELAFENISKLLIEKFPEGKVFNTICDSTHKRQDEVRNLCRKVDALVVVGGKSSANTQRLGEIARSMDRPVFMAETEDDLDIDALCQYETVGVTAGASTPTWMINRIVRAIESIPGAGDSLAHSLAYKLTWLVLATNLYVSLGGGLLTYASTVLLGIEPRLVLSIIAFGYLFSMHNLNRFGEHTSKKFNDPVRAGFCHRYRWPLLVLAAASLTGSLVLAYFQGTNPFMLLLGISILGLLYRVRFIPSSIAAVIGVRRIKEIPGSKTLLIALAWAFVTVLIPVLVQGRIHVASPVVLSVFVFIMLLVFVRNALFDIFDVQGDRIVGKETLPVYIGEKKTMRLLRIIMAVMSVALLVAPWTGSLGFRFWFMLPAVMCLFIITKLYDQKLVIQGPKLEFALESVFAITSGLAWLSSITI